MKPVPLYAYAAADGCCPQSLRLEDGALLDVELEIGGHLPASPRRPGRLAELYPVLGQHFGDRTTVGVAQASELVDGQGPREGRAPPPAAAAVRPLLSLPSHERQSRR